MITNGIINLDCMCSEEGMDPFADYESLSGCTDPSADNYNPEATDSNPDLCIYSGCTDPDASNYNNCEDIDGNPIDCTEDDGSCYYEGCTNSYSPNYDPNATVDDGSCEEPEGWEEGVPPTFWFWHQPVTGTWSGGCYVIQNGDSPDFNMIQIQNITADQIGQFVSTPLQFDTQVTGDLSSAMDSNYMQDDPALCTIYADQQVCCVSSANKLISYGTNNPNIETLAGMYNGSNCVTGAITDSLVYVEVEDVGAQNYGGYVTWASDAPDPEGMAPDDSEDIPDPEGMQTTPETEELPEWEEWVIDVYSPPIETPEIEPIEPEIEPIEPIEPGIEPIEPETPIPPTPDIEEPENEDE